MGALRGFAQKCDFSWLLSDEGRERSEHLSQRLLQSREILGARVKVGDVGSWVSLKVKLTVVA